MTTSKFIKKLIIRTVIIAFILMLLSTLNYSLNAVIGNYTALEQMQNDDVAFIIKELYFNFVRPVCTCGITLASVCFIGFTIYDVIKFINNKKED